MQQQSAAQTRVLLTPVVIVNCISSTYLSHLSYMLTIPKLQDMK